MLREADAPFDPDAGCDGLCCLPRRTAEKPPAKAKKCCKKFKKGKRCKKCPKR